MNQNLYVQKAVKIVDTNSLESLISKFEGDNIDFHISELTSFLLDKFRQVYHLLNLSILEGEYIIRNKEVDESIDNLVNKLKEVATIEVNTSHPTSNNLISDLLSDNFSKQIIDSLRKYKHLVLFVLRKISSFDDSTTLLDVYRNEKKEGLLNKIIPVDDYVALFEQNVLLAKIDHELKVDKAILQRLLIISDVINRNEIQDSVTELLKQKCHFLTFKIYYRFQQNKENYKYAIDFIDKPIQISDDKIISFKKYHTKIVNHYNDNIGGAFARKIEVNQFYDCIESSKDVDMFLLHTVVKYYKDDKLSLEQLNNLVNTFLEKQSKVKSKESKFDAWALKQIIIYLRNNLFSLKLQKGLEMHQWFDLLKEYENVQETQSIKNYFIYEKSLAFLDKKISDLFNTVLPEIDKISSAISHYEFCLNKYIECVKWCENKSLSTFQLPFDECIVPFEWNDSGSTETIKINAFISSSFVLPLNYRMLRENQQIYKANILRYNTTLAIQNQLKLEKEELKKIKEKTEAADKRSIEILSIFSAIVLFVAGDIQIFTKINNTIDAVYFMLLFGFVLGCFVLLIWFITRNEGINYKALTLFHKLIMLLFLGGAIFCYLLLTGRIKPSHSEDESALINQKYKIDSLENELKIKQLSKNLDTSGLKR